MLLVEVKLIFLKAAYSFISCFSLRLSELLMCVSSMHLYVQLSYTFLHVCRSY